MSAVEAAAGLPHPLAPATLEESGLSGPDIQLVLKTLHSGTPPDRSLNASGSDSRSSAQPRPAKWQHHAEIVGGSMTVVRPSKHRITDEGLGRAVPESNQHGHAGVSRNTSAWSVSGRR
jgi:hypothetical protein